MNQPACVTREHVFKKRIQWLENLFVFFSYAKQKHLAFTQEKEATPKSVLKEYKNM